MYSLYYLIASALGSKYCSVHLRECSALGISIFSTIIFNGPRIGSDFAMELVHTWVDSVAGGHS